MSDSAHERAFSKAGKRKTRRRGGLLFALAAGTKDHTTVARHEPAVMVTAVGDNLLGYATCLARRPAHR